MAKVLINSSCPSHCPGLERSRYATPRLTAGNGAGSRAGRHPGRRGPPPPNPAGIYITPEVGGAKRADSIKRNKWAFGRFTIYFVGFRQGPSELSVARTKGFINAIVPCSYIECDQVTAEPPVGVLHRITLNYIQHDDWFTTC